VHKPSQYIYINEQLEVAWSLLLKLPSEVQNYGYAPDHHRTKRDEVHRQRSQCASSQGKLEKREKRERMFLAFFIPQTSAEKS